MMVHIAIPNIDKNAVGRVGSYLRFAKENTPCGMHQNEANGFDLTGHIY